MGKTKYPISREYLPLSLYTPTMSRQSIARTNRIYRIPKSLFRDPSLSIKTVGV